MALESMLIKNYVVVGLGERAHKKLFSQKKFFSLLDDNKGWILVSLPGKCSFSYLFLIFRDLTGHREKSIRKYKRVATQKQTI
jgi:hypothetical protein